MNSVSTKSALLFYRNLRFSRSDDSNVGFFSAITDRKLNFLQETLQVNLRREVDLRQELIFHENQFISSSERKNTVAELLLKEERRWKTCLEGAERKKNAAASLYLSELLQLKSNLQRTRRDIESSAVELDHDATLQLLEDQKMKFRNAESQLMSTTQEADSLKEKPQVVADLVKKFLEARDHSHQASSKFQMAKTNWTNINKDIIRINNLIQSINDSMPSSFARVMSSRFWRSVGEMLAINFRQRSYSL